MTDKHDQTDVDDPAVQRCIGALEHAAERLGHSPSIAEYESLGLTPSVNTIQRMCGSWNRAKELADLDTERRGATQQITRDDLAHAIEAVDERVAGDLGPEEYEAHRDDDHPSLPTFYHRTEGFASFRNRVLGPSSYTDADIKTALREAVTDLDADQLTTRQYDQWRSPKVDPSKNAICANPSAPYESWDAALEAAGVDAGPGQAMGHTKVDLIDAYRRVREIVGEHPTLEQYEEHRRASDPNYSYLYQQNWPDITSWSDLRRAGDDLSES